KTLMVIGMDSYHDLKRRTSSVGAFVASTNQTLTKFYSRIIYQRTTQELMDGLTQCLTDALKEYHRNNNCLPEKIVLYRDGVSDGQLAIIAEHELPQIVETFPKIMPGYEPKLAVVIVKKRGNARFFQRSGRSILNPAPGTIIDHTVTNTDWYDFYLISQCARQGTVSPTHYNVIWDRTNFKVDHMQRLTYKLCHLYYNWPGTIRVPAVCQLGALQCLQIRHETTNTTQTSPSTDLATLKRSNLMDFFDTSDTMADSKIIHGRWWHMDELRLKSNEDLHKLWYVLLKERNVLLTMEEEFRYQHELFPNPERIDKIEESMRNILNVVRERNIAYNLLETGKTGEQQPIFRKTSFGLLRFYKPKHHIVPPHMNTWYKLLWGNRKPSKWTKIMERRYNEVKNNEEHLEMERIKKVVDNVIQKYPHLEKDREFVMERYKERLECEFVEIPDRFKNRPKLKPHETVWDEDEFYKKGVYDDPNKDDYEIVVKK
ncbi:unnamed protein product, partial [Didymodactylos carnosus]